MWFFIFWAVTTTKPLTGAGLNVFSFSIDALTSLLLTCFHIYLKNTSLKIQSMYDFKLSFIFTFKFNMDLKKPFSITFNVLFQPDKPSEIILLILLSVIWFFLTILESSKTQVSKKPSIFMI
ncbi:hypothetical protein CDIK_2315 [Cucumispora dikerogammari]|nr:hypothetical protein CDIK_2315 [Cucumispora dikerogammari]